MSETIEDIVCYLRKSCEVVDGNGSVLDGGEIADRIETANKREMDGLRSLVKELADALECRLCDYACEINGECPAGMKKEECESFKFRALVAMAREVVK